MCRQKKRGASQSLAFLLEGSRIALFVENEQRRSPTQDTYPKSHKNICERKASHTFRDIRIYTSRMSVPVALVFRQIISELARFSK